MDNKTSNLGLSSGPPRLYKTPEEREAQWQSGPKVLGPNLAAKIVQRNKVAGNAAADAIQRNGR